MNKTKQIIILIFSLVVQKEIFFSGLSVSRGDGETNFEWMQVFPLKNTTAKVLFSLLMIIDNENSIWVNWEIFFF